MSEFFTWATAHPWMTFILLIVLINGITGMFHRFVKSVVARRSIETPARTFAPPLGQAENEEDDGTFHNRDGGVELRLPRDFVFQPPPTADHLLEIPRPQPRPVFPATTTATRPTAWERIDRDDDSLP